MSSNKTNQIGVLRNVGDILKRQNLEIGDKTWKSEINGGKANSPNSPQNHVKWLISWGILKKVNHNLNPLAGENHSSHLSKNDSTLATFLLYFTKYYKFWNSEMLAIEKCKKISWEYWNFRTLNEKHGVYFDWNIVTP